MINEGLKYGLEAPFKRTQKLSTDMASAIDVWKHGFIKCEEYFNKNFDITILLEPSSPLRQPIHIEKTVKKLINGHFDSVLTISETDSKSHPFKQLQIDGRNVKYYDVLSKDVIARQELKPLYHRNGVCYALTRDCLLNQGKIIGDNPSYVIIEDHVVNIDTKLDLELAKYFIENKNDL